MFVCVHADAGRGNDKQHQQRGTSANLEAIHRRHLNTDNVLSSEEIPDRLNLHAAVIFGGSGARKQNDKGAQSIKSNEMGRGAQIKRNEKGGGHKSNDVIATAATTLITYCTAPAGCKG